MRHSRLLPWLCGFAAVLGIVSCGSWGGSRPKGKVEPIEVRSDSASSSERSRSGEEVAPRNEASASTRDRPPKMEVRRTRVGSVASASDRDAEPSVPDSSRTGPASQRLIPARLLVGLESDLEAVEIGCCREPVRLFNARQHFDLATNVVVRAWSVDSRGNASPTLFFVQVSALKDQQQAEALAARLDAVLGRPAAVVFDARSDLYKVRVGPMSSRASADSLKPTLEKLGYRQPFVLREANLETSSGFEVQFEGPSERMTVQFSGRHLLVERPSHTVRYGKQDFRGRLLLFANDRGRINVVNQVGIEDYLRGVVPKELGPDLYPQLEALKAQAIAARTYTLKNLGEFLAEGYDICSTPRCQVYGGMAAEHRLSDQAIRETAGELLVTRIGGVSSEEVIVDAMFSASCGGHTENVGSVFPLKNESYLQARPCIEKGTTRLVGSQQSLVDLVVEGFDEAAFVELNSSRARLEAGLLALAKAANLAIPEDQLASVAAGEVRRYLGSVFDLFLDRRWLEPRDEAMEAIAPEPAHAKLAQVLGVLAGLSPNQRLADEEQERLVVAMAEALGILTLESARFSSWDGSKVVIHRGRGGQPLVYEDELSLFADAAERWMPRSSLKTFPGDAVQVLMVQGRPIGLVGSTRDRSGLHPIIAKRWRRFRSLERIQELVAERYPGFVVSGLGVESRGSSGRVEKLVLTGKDGGSEVVVGLAIRWILDLPDTWFEIEKKQRGGVEGWLFSGRGRGHGVGMCQVGAYGMAILGAGYRDILAHYYSGAEVVGSVVAQQSALWDCNGLSSGVAASDASCP